MNQVAEQQRLQARQQLHQRRLQHLEMQVARYGIATPPHILMEIEEIQAQMTALAVPRPTVPGSDGQRVPWTILFLSSDPMDLPHIRLGHELRTIKERLQLALMRNDVVLHQRECVRSTDLIQAMLEVRPSIVHFAGHGNRVGALYLEDEAGKAHAVTAEAFAALLRLFKEDVKCVILNACYTTVHATALTQEIAYVIGMGSVMSDRAALAFSTGFYQALGAGVAIEAAYHFGCTQIGLQGLPEQELPVLYQKKAYSLSP